ncbi:MAG: peptidase [Rhodobacter sp.]|nr:peptidase [Rhodobacter sp.]MCA3512390.1 peptidase [Rhodobacter sp.]MCA3520629.1 peptidase [Rhodobacter sp.]MCA3523771.1 peptidase [Rhodobacter sp.]MCA3525115.1 peptidase [Rhodobacter sp.]
MSWIVHFLNARGAFSQTGAGLRAAVEDARTLLEARSAPKALDVIVKASTHAARYPFSVGGACYEPGCIELTVDFSRNAALDTLREEILRTLCHEYHHAIRWDGPGYGDTLGEALVSEGLAQVFVHEVIPCPPEPWEIMPPDLDLRKTCKRAYDGFDDADYAHDEWFFGSGSLPNWTGYALGKALVARHLQTAPGKTALDLALEPAAVFRETLKVLAKDR